MVTFTCSYCGDSVRKNQVEKHYSFKRCVNRKPALTCVDCLKDFSDQEYVAHTSCITEDEKYSAKGFVPKTPKNTGKKKQEMWISAINDYLNSGVPINNEVRIIVQAICNNPGLPQKKVKFMNFCKTLPGTRHTKPPVWEKVWEVLEKVKMQLRSQSNDNLGKKNTDSQEDRKRKRVDSENEPSNNDVESSDKCQTENSNLTASKLKKKPKSNKIALSKELEVEMNDVEGKNSIEDIKQCEETVELSSIIKSKKQRKLQEMGELEHIDVKQSTLSNGSVENSEIVKLSKKERKQKLKQEKYEKELKNVENEVPDKLFDDENEVEETEKKKKKKKKNVKVNNGYSNVTCELESHEEYEVKGKKKKNAESQEQENEFTGNTLDIAISKPSKFNWEETIIKVLEAKGELPLKRLEKKVVNEYLNCHEYATSVEVIVKFNRKVLKIPRVKVKKEVARLVS